MNEGQIKYPELSGTRWVSMSRATSFFLDHRSQHFEEVPGVQSAVISCIEWWIILPFVNILATEVNKIVHRLPGKEALLSQETEEDFGKCASLNWKCDHIVAGKLQFEAEHLKEVLCEQGLFVIRALRELEFNSVRGLIQFVAEAFSTLIEGLGTVCAERDERNCSSAINMFSLLPHELVLLRRRDFANIVDYYYERMSKS